MMNSPILPRKLRVLSAGAARVLLEDAAPVLLKEHGVVLDCEHAPVGVVQEWLADGRPADLIALSRDSMGQELVGLERALWRPRSLGIMTIGFYRRADDPMPVLDTVDAFRAALLGSPLLLLADLQRSSGGRHLAGIFDRLGIQQEIAQRIRLCAGGFQAASDLAAQRQPGVLAGAHPAEADRIAGIVSAGMPEEFQLRTEYCIAAAIPEFEPIAEAIAAIARKGGGGFTPIIKEQPN
jgi:molybdate transport system substrate-binding protein